MFCKINNYHGATHDLKPVFVLVMQIVLKNVLLQIPFILELGKTILGISNWNQFKLLMKLLKKEDLVNVFKIIMYNYVNPACTLNISTMFWGV